VLWRAGGPGVRVVVHTGLWGCGVSRGNPVLMTLLQTLAAEMAGLTQIVFHVGDPSGRAPAQQALAIGRSLASDVDVVATRPLIRRIEEIDFEWGGARPIADRSFLGAPSGPQRAERLR
jgi:hypothetical protein